MLIDCDFQRGYRLRNRTKKEKKWRMFRKNTLINNRYEIIDTIGRGGTSTVYLVLDKHIGRNLALKVINRKSIGSIRFAKSEIESLRRVHYPLIPGIHDAFTYEGRICIVSDYVRGTPLSKICADGGMEKYEALLLVKKVCEALVYLHGMRQPLLYLDLKPDNIIVSSDHLPHLIDFGIAGWLAARHIPVGTRGYSPPEQYMTDPEMDERTDIFAMGMTYYSMRCGVPPDPDPDKALLNIKHSKILGFKEKSFLLKCCALAKEDRFQSAREVLKQINHIRSIPRRIRNTIVASTICVALVISAVYAVFVRYETKSKNKAAADLTLGAAGYMSQGQYTPEGIGMIKAFVNSGTLPEECEQEYIFEVAINSLLVEGDLLTASAYFKRLDEKRFPEVAYYMKICELENSFDRNDDEAMEVLGKMLSDVSRRSASLIKFENMIFIARCYERYDQKEGVGSKKIAGCGRITVCILPILFCFPARPDAILCPSAGETSREP